MSRDLIFGRTRRNWSRGSCSPKRLAMTDEVDFIMTTDEMKMVADVASVRAAADSGDTAARRKLTAFMKKVRGLESRAKKGDASAKRTILVLKQSGVFSPSKPQSIALGDDSSSQVDHTSYRIAVLRQAGRRAKMSGGRRPTTRDFYLAKKDVDGVMSQNGISLYLPGSRPSRLTL